MAKLYYSGPVIEHTGSGSIDKGRLVAVVGGVAVLADKDNSTHRHNVRGYSIADYTDGQTVCIQVDGRITVSTWSWTADQPIYLGTNGNPTQTKPTSGFLLQVGTAEATDEVFVLIGQAEDATSRHKHLRESFTLSGSDITNKYVLLGQTPLTSANVRLEVEGAGFQNYGNSFQMDGVNPKKLTWDGLSLEPLLSAGMVIVASYEKGID